MIIKVYKTISIKILKVKIYIQFLDLYIEILIVKTIIRIQVSKVIKEIKNTCVKIAR